MNEPVVGFHVPAVYHGRRWHFLVLLGWDGLVRECPVAPCGGQWADLGDGAREAADTTAVAAVGEVR